MDPWGRAFSRDYQPSRWRMAGRVLVASGFKAVLDGIQADLEFVKKVLFLQRISTAFDSKALKVRAL